MLKYFKDLLYNKILIAYYVISNNNTHMGCLCPSKSFINDYQVIRSIGKGSFGEVFLVQSVNKEVYALKRIDITDPTLRDEVMKEGKLLNKLNHRNILEAIEFFLYNHQTQFIIITPYCSQGNICKLIGMDNFEFIKKIMIGITSGVHHLHQNSIIHRDLKPQNILISDGHPKICDLGLATIVNHSGAVSVVGTPFYMSHQMLNSNTYTFSVDIWALGIIFLELLIGKRIFRLIEGRKIPSERQEFPNNDLMDKICNPQMRNIVELMLKRSPQQRITALEVLTRLNNLGKYNIYENTQLKPKGKLSNIHNQQKSRKPQKSQKKDQIIKTTNNQRKYIQKQQQINQTIIDFNKQIKEQTRQEIQYKKNALIQTALQQGWQPIVRWATQGKRLQQMVTLNMVFHNLKRIIPLTSLVRLKTLQLNNNEIKKIQNLNQLSALTTLRLYNNQISKLQNLDQLNSLLTLNLNYNPIIVNNHNKQYAQSLRNKKIHVFLTVNLQ